VLTLLASKCTYIGYCANDGEGKKCFIKSFICIPISVAFGHSGTENTHALTCKESHSIASSCAEAHGLLKLLARKGSSETVTECVLCVPEVR